MTRSFALPSQRTHQRAAEQQGISAYTADPSTDLLHEYEISQFARGNQFKTRSRNKILILSLMPGEEEARNAVQMISRWAMSCQ